VNAAPFDASSLPSNNFRPRIYGVGAWTEHIFFGYDLAAQERPGIFVELGTDRGESYFAFCQSVAENQKNTRCFAVDTWKGDAHSGFYDETTFQQVDSHNRTHYQLFSHLLRRTFDEALAQFGDGKIDILHLDGLHSESAVRHDLDNWLPKVATGGLVLLHDVNVRARGFGVWKVWDQLKQRGRSFTFNHGPGLGLWEKPPQRTSGFVNTFLDPNSEARAALIDYYNGKSRELQRRMAEEWQTGAIRQSPSAQETVIQIFYTSDGTHREVDSVNARIGHDSWKDVSITLPAGAGASPLRIDFVSALNVIDIASIRVLGLGQVLFQAAATAEFHKINIRGDADRLPHSNFLRLQITGIDPQLYLPPISSSAGNWIVEMRLRVHTGIPGD